MLFVVSAVLFDMLKARQLACVSKSGQKCPAALSLSSWRAWIEIASIGGTRCKQGQSLSSWRAWIEIICAFVIGVRWASLSSWRAWIEIGRRAVDGIRWRKSLSSWRAWIEISCAMSRGIWGIGRSPHGERGLKYEILRGEFVGFGSLSSWRAWIEILPLWPSTTGPPWSLSSWRAWIEIVGMKCLRRRTPVALLMESVD